MPTKIGWSTRGYIESIPLPKHGSTYTVIPHKDVIEKVYETFAANNLVVEKELYRVTLNGNVASAVYHLKSDLIDDPELGLIFFWLNSYDKSRAFTCSVGAYNKNKDVYYIKGDISSWVRRHRGEADKEYGLNITNQIDIANDYFTAIIKDRNSMMRVKVSEKDIAHIMGEAYFTHEILSTDQATGFINLSKDKNSIFNKTETLWELYTKISFCIKSSHPSKWFNNQCNLHDLVMTNYCKLSTNDDQLPGQLSIFDVIEDTTELVPELETQKDYFDLTDYGL
jgi:hypothetical protein